MSTPTKKLTPLPQIQPFKMSRKDTAALIGRARREKVSVYSAICASLVSVYWNRLNPAEENDVRLFVPFNLRPRLGIGSNLMLALSPGLISIPHSSHSSFWQFARSLDEMVAKTHTDEHIVQTASAFGLALRYNPTPAKLAEFCDRSFGFQFLTSRLKELRIKSKSAPLKLLSVWGPSILIGPPGAQSVGISTADAQLHFLLTSYEPKPAFLEDGASLLRVACDS